MSREATWKHFGYVVGSARNPEFDKLKGVRNKKCAHCEHQHELGQAVCRLLMTEHNKEEDTYRFYKCNCNAIQEIEQLV
jgi:hypothetical protein